MGRGDQDHLGKTSEEFVLCHAGRTEEGRGSWARWLEAETSLS